MASNRIQELTQLKDNVAGLNQRAAQQEKAALGMSLQSAVQKAPTAPGSATTAAQQLAPQATQAASQIAATSARKTQAVQGQLTQQQIQDSAFQYSQKLKKESQRLTEEIFKRDSASGMLITNEELSARKRIIKSDLQASKRIAAAGMYYDKSIQFATWQARHSLQSVSQAAKAEYMDSRLTFRREQGQLKLSNEHQLHDFAATSARSRQDYENKAQLIEQASITELKALSRAQEILEQRLQIDAQIRGIDITAEFKAAETSKKQTFLSGEQQRRTRFQLAEQVDKAEWLRHDAESRENWQDRQQLLTEHWKGKEQALDNESRMAIIKEVAAIKETQRIKQQRRMNRARRNAMGGRVIGMAVGVAVIAASGGTAAPAYIAAASAGGAGGEALSYGI